MNCKSCNKKITEYTYKHYNGKCVPCFRSSPHRKFLSSVENIYAFRGVLFGPVFLRVSSFISLYCYKVVDEPLPKMEYSNDEEESSVSLDVGCIKKLYWPSLVLNASLHYSFKGNDSKKAAPLILTINAKGRGEFSNIGFRPQFKFAGNEVTFEFPGESLGTDDDGNTFKTFIFTIPHEAAKSITDASRVQGWLGFFQLNEMKRMHKALEMLLKEKTGQNF